MRPPGPALRPGDRRLQRRLFRGLGLRHHARRRSTRAAACAASWCPGGAALEPQAGRRARGDREGRGRGWAAAREAKAGGATTGPMAKFLADDGAATRSRSRTASSRCFVAGAGPRRESRRSIACGRSARARLGLVDERRAALPVGDRLPDVRPGSRRPARSAPCTIRSPSPNPEDMAAHPTSRTAGARWRTTSCSTALELGGGSIRIARLRRCSRACSRCSASATPTEQERRFGFLLEGLRAGAPPHGGIAFGFDRIAMLLAGATSLRDVIAFPKTTAARALFEGAPAPVPAEELRDAAPQAGGRLMADGTMTGAGAASRHAAPLDRRRRPAHARGRRPTRTCSSCRSSSRCA